MFVSQNNVLTGVIGVRAESLRRLRLDDTKTAWDQIWGAGILKAPVRMQTLR